MKKHRAFAFMIFVFPFDEHTLSEGIWFVNRRNTSEAPRQSGSALPSLNHIVESRNTPTRLITQLTRNPIRNSILANKIIQVKLKLKTSRKLVLLKTIMKFTYAVAMIFIPFVCCR